jgi:hypothetical protein
MHRARIASAERLRRSAFETLARYLGPKATITHPAFGPDRSHDFSATGELVGVPMPTWASDIGIGAQKALLVDKACLARAPDHSACDWLLAAGLHLEGWLERAVEQARGPIHSYAFRLPANAAAAYDHAWVNRIGLFLRRALSQATGRPESEICGPAPQPRIILTHDVDALEKTVQLRLKSSVMSGLAILRHLGGLRFGEAGNRLASAIRYATGNADYRLFEEIMALEERHGMKSVFLFSDYRTSGPRAWLIDPSYRVADANVAAHVRAIILRGWQLGIHPGYESWNYDAAIGALRQSLEATAGTDVHICRQHWLRFSWADTWRAQCRAGVRLDLTLGFNDRPGFRNGSALRHRPMSCEAQGGHGLAMIPNLFMDSHFYDYAFPTDVSAAMKPWIDEVIAVGGEASVIWHSQTMHPEFGWADGYAALLAMLAERGVTRTMIECEDLG